MFIIGTREVSLLARRGAEPLQRYDTSEEMRISESARTHPPTWKYGIAHPARLPVAFGGLCRPGADPQERFLGAVLKENWLIRKSRNASSAPWKDWSNWSRLASSWR